MENVIHDMVPTQMALEKNSALFCGLWDPASYFSFKLTKS